MNLSSWIELGVLLVGLSASLALAWWRSWRVNEQKLSIWRKRALRLGLMGNTALLVLYLADLVRFQLIMRGVVRYTGSGLADSGRVLFTLIALGLASGICGAFGHGVTRLLVIVNGILLAILWCF